MRVLVKLFSYVTIFILSGTVLLFNSCSEDSPTQSEPDPTQNLLPGVAYMGHGYNVFGDYAKTEYVKSALFKFENYQTISVNGKSFNMPSDIEYIYINSSDFKSVHGLTSHEYRESMSINASLGGSYGFFSLSVKNNYSETYYKSSYRAFCTIQNVIKQWKLTLPYTDFNKLKSFLTDEAKNDIANLSPETLFNKYGTHFIAELIIGARADYNTCVTKSTETSSIKNNFQICAEASFKKASGSGSYSMVTEQQLQTFESNSYRDLKVSGGRSEYGSYIFQAGKYDMWIESINNIENLTISDFTDNSLIPIWELCADDTRKNELSTAFVNYAQQFELPALLNEAIDDFYFEVSDYAVVTPDPGWSMINVDLNRDAGGKYIFLCYKNELDDQEVVSDVTFILNSQATPAGYIKMQQDLNEGCGGSTPYIYMCYKKEYTSNPIRRVNVLIGENAQPEPGFYFAENYYSQVKQDLNQGASGNYIWMVYSYDLPNAWQ